MTRRTRLFTALMSATAISMGCADTSAPVCRGAPDTVVPTSEAVCARLNAINCPILDCLGAYRAWQLTVAPGAFARVTACYLAASSCREVDDCARACGSGGPIAPITDASVTDAR